MDPEDPQDPVKRLHELGEHSLAMQLQKRLEGRPDAQTHYAWQVAPKASETTEEDW